jgi:Ni,Fe-hydrogenase I large subunit
VYSIFFEELCKHTPYLKNVQYGIGAIAVHILHVYNLHKTPNLTSVIENADIIVCEQIRHYDMLNTTECEQNMFNNFNIKPTCKVISVPNLECQYENTPESKLQNVTRLIIVKNISLKNWQTTFMQMQTELIQCSLLTITLPLLWFVN